MTSAVVISNRVGVRIIPLLPLVCITLKTLADQESGVFLSALSSPIIDLLLAQEGGKKENPLKAKRLSFPIHSLDQERIFTQYEASFHCKHLLVH